MRRMCCLWLGVLLALPARAQFDTLTVPGATLAGWTEGMRVALRDVRHAHGGATYDRGLLRRLTPRMDHEYLLEADTYRFSPVEDAAWYGSDNGLRLFLCSISNSQFISRLNARTAVPINGATTFRANIWLQEDLQAKRPYGDGGFETRLHGTHRVGFNLSLGTYKPDLDLGFTYRVGTPQTGEVHAEIAALDFLNNLVFDVLKADPVIEDTIRSYAGVPLGATVRAASPHWHGWRGEVTAGGQPYLTATYRRQSDPTATFDFGTGFGFAGALVEYALPFGTAGVAGQVTASRMARTAPPGSAFTSEYRARQTERRVGAFVTGAVGRFQGEAWLWHERYTDTQTGTDFDQATIPQALAYDERRTLYKARVDYRLVPKVFFVGLGVQGEDRRYRRDRAPMVRYLVYEPYSPNRRANLWLTLRLRDRAFFRGGASIDLDRDTFYTNWRERPRFDGGFGQLVVGW